MTTTGQIQEAERILDEVLVICNVSIAEMGGDLRGKRVVTARRMFVGVAHQLTECSYPALMAMMGRSHACHSTAITQNARHFACIENDAETFQEPRRIGKRRVWVRVRYRELLGRLERALELEEGTLTCEVAA